MRGRLPSASRRPARADQRAGIVEHVDHKKTEHDDDERQLAGAGEIELQKRRCKRRRRRHDALEFGKPERHADERQARMPISVAPTMLRKLSATITTKPAKQRIAGHCLRSPSVTSVAGFATTIFASSSAMMPRNSPTPAEIANLRFFGIELMMYSRILKIEMRKKITPEQNTAPTACCQLYFC